MISKPFFKLRSLVSRNRLLFKALLLQEPSQTLNKREVGVVSEVNSAIFLGSKQTFESAKWITSPFGQLTPRDQSSGKKSRQALSRLVVSSVVTFGTIGSCMGQTSFTSNAATGAWSTNRWNNSTDGPTYSSAFTANNAVSFTSGSYSFSTGMGGSTINIGNVTVANGVNVNFTGSVSGTYATGGLVRTISVGSNGLFDLSNQNISTAGSTGFSKNGAGAFATAGSAYTGGFTLNAGTIVMRGINAMGQGSVTLNGGTVASNGDRNVTSRYTSFNILGDVQFGEVTSNVSIVSNTANLTFADNITLGSAGRTLTLGNGGTMIFSGVVSNSGSGGLSFAANSNGTGRFEVTNTSNTFTGNVSVNGGEVRFAADGSLGNAANNIVIDGGRFATTNSASYTIASGRGIQIGDGVGTSISTPGSGTLTFNGVIANKAGETGSWAKQGGGTLELGGVSTYTGDTAINNGTLRLTTGNDRLPTGTTVSLGQAASTNLGTLDLSGRNQQIAGLNSITGTNASANKNTVTSATAAILTLGGSGTYTYGDGTPQNSGTIGGAISLVKSGSGTQVLGDANTYTGGTSINGGTLAIGNASALGTTGTISFGGGTLQYNGITTDLSNRFSTAPTQAYSINTNGNNVTFASNLTSVGGSLAKSGAGTLTLSGTNSYTGGTTVSGGTLAISGGGTLGATTSNLAVNSAGTLDLGGTNQTVGAVTLNGGTISNGSLTGTSYTSTGGLISANLGGDSTVAFTNTSGSTTLSGANTFSGGVNVDGGTVTVSGGGSLASQSFAVDTGASLIASTATLTGTGTNTINGTLDANLTLSSGATLQGAGDIWGNVTVGSGSTLAPGNSIGTLAILGDLDLSGTYNWEVDFGNQLADVTLVGSNLTLGGVLNMIPTGTANLGEKYTLFAYNGTRTGVFSNTLSGWTINYADTTSGLNAAFGTSYVTITAVPEPSSIALIGVTCVGGFLVRYRRKKKAAEGASADDAKQAE